MLEARRTIFWSGAYRVVVKDSLGNAIWTMDGISDLAYGAGLRADLASFTDGAKGAGLVGFGPTVSYGANTIGTFLQAIHARTAAEISAGVTPTNYSILPHTATGKFDLRRYGAAETYSAIVDDLPFWNTAISVINATANKTGDITGPVRTYRINGTLTISINVGIDFGPSSNGNSTQGMCLFSDTNLPILVFDTPAVSRFVSWANFTVCGTSVKAGTGTAKTSQHGITINNRGTWLNNVSIRACGGISLRVLDSNGAIISNVYASLGDGTAVVFDYLSSANVSPSVGFNVLINVIGSNCSGNGLHVISSDGRNTMLGCDFEQNTGVGRKFGSGVLGWTEYTGHSELNTGGSVVWDATSNYNEIGTIWGDSGGVEADPVNNGLIGNRIGGQKFASGGGGFNTQRVGPLMIGYGFAEYSAAANSAPNAIPFDDTPPQASGEGATRMSLTYVPKMAGTRLRIFGQVCMAISAGTYAIAAVFNNLFSATDAQSAEAVAVAADTLVVIPFSAEYTTTSTSSVNINVNIGSSSAATVYFNSTSTGRKFGAANKSFIRVEEFYGIP
jgi:hypothetical protein